MDWRGDPHPEMEPVEKEIDEVDRALDALVGYDVLPHKQYDFDLFTAHRNGVKAKFEIPWTGISPRVQRLLYAVNAVVQPKVLVAMGVFCGNTFISNAGAALGPGRCYKADSLVGIEIIAEEAERAKRNVEAIDAAGEAEIIAADGIEWLHRYEGKIDLLYIDANGSYLQIAEVAAKGKLREGACVLAHNSVNMVDTISDYLEFVRDDRNSVASVNIVIDDQGLEVTRWR